MDTRGGFGITQDTPAEVVTAFDTHVYGMELVFGKERTQAWLKQPANVFDEEMDIFSTMLMHATAFNMVAEMLEGYGYTIEGVG